MRATVILKAPNLLSVGHAATALIPAGKITLIRPVIPDLLA
jgi:hypothetical protein